MFDLPPDLMKEKEKELYANFRTHRDQCDTLGLVFIYSLLLLNKMNWDYYYYDLLLFF